ncbi:MAG: NAD(P)/FAD-dependent oxidoreductase [Halothece sp.]
MNNLVQQTIIVGGGFTGLFTALHLSNNNYPYSIILIDRQERFCFRPLLYDYFCNQMDANQVRPNYEELLKGRNISFVKDNVESIDLEKQEVKLSSGTTCPYSNLVLGLGSVTGYFGVNGAKENALPFRGGKDAIALDHHLQNCLEKALSTANDQERHKLLTVAIVGGGPTGVELAATLADLLPHWYEALGGKGEEIRMVLLNRGSEILKGDINDPLRNPAKNALEKRAVKVEMQMEAKVTAVHPNTLEYQQNNQTKMIPTATTVWTAGTALNPVIQALPIQKEKRDKKGRLLVKPTQQLLDFPNVFAGGDCAAIQDHSYPPTAQVAYQQGKAIADNLERLANGKEPKAANISIRGTLMKLGLQNGGANLFNEFEVNGEVAHLIRQATYLSLLPTPIHDFKITLKWINDEILQEYLEPEKAGNAVKWIAGGIVGIAVAKKLMEALSSDRNQQT